MSATTMTFTHASATDALLARAGAGAARALRSVATLFEAGTRNAPTTAAALLERADEYEATQPSYAADLRAAAGHVNA